MKKLIFTLFSLVAIQASYAQTTYYYVGGSAPTNQSFNTSTYWNTIPGGGGSPRTTPAASDILIFDGSDISDEPGIQTGAVVWAITSPTSGTGPSQLKFVNNANVTLSRFGSGGTTTVTIAGSTPIDNDPDLVVQAGSRFAIGGTTGSFVVVLSANATGEVSGSVVFESNGNNTTNQNRLVSLTKGALVFMPGSSATTTANYGYNPFGTSGSSATPAAHFGVVFMAGSTFTYAGGLSPFGTTSTISLIDFRPGSTFFFQKANAASMFTNRAYANVVIQNNSTVTGDGSLYKMDTLTIETGSTFITHTSGSTPINGNIINNGTFAVPSADPNRGNRLVMISSVPQTIGGTGTYTLADFIISNVSNVTLAKSIQVDSSTVIFGTLNPNGNSITGTGTTTIKTPASINITATTVIDSFLIRNISDMTGIEIGMSVTGTGIQPNSVITNLSTTAGTVTLSKPVTASNSGASLTVFNGNGVLPVKFGAIAVNLTNGQSKINWNVLTETNISKYVIERSANGSRYDEIGTVSATGRSSYNFIDVNPITGNNFYRIKSIGTDGAIVYSNVLRVNNGKGKSEMSVYPNPVVAGNLNMALTNITKGSYTLQLFNHAGQGVYTKALSIDGGSINQTITLPGSLASGNYTLTLKGDNVVFKQAIIIQ